MAEIMQNTTETLPAPGTIVLPPGQPSPDSPLPAGIPGWLKIAGVGILVYLVLIKS